VRSVFGFNYFLGLLYNGVGEQRRFLPLLLPGWIFRFLAVCYIWFRQMRWPGYQISFPTALVT
jgi:hypothetical protein